MKISNFFIFELSKENSYLDKKIFLKLLIYLYAPNFSLSLFSSKDFLGSIKVSNSD